MRTLLSLMISTTLASTAFAGYPDDVKLSAMSEWRGSTVENPTAVGSAYDIVIRQLGAGIMNAPLAPAETLGVNGFDLSVGSTFAFLSARGENINQPAPWERIHQDENPTHVLWRPGVTMRKGLPLSLEVGANWSWVGFSRQTALGGFGRWSILEGWKKAPDITLQMGYTGYVGNDELELGALDGRLSIGHTFPIGYLIGINHADVVPFAGVGFLKINAAPRLPLEEQGDLGISAVSGIKSNDNYAEGFSLFTTHLGMRIRSGDFHITTSGAIVAKALPTVNMSVGLTY